MLTRKIIKNINLDQLNPIVKVMYWLDNEDNIFKK